MRARSTTDRLVSAMHDDGEYSVASAEGVLTFRRGGRQVGAWHVSETELDACVRRLDGEARAALGRGSTGLDLLLSHVYSTLDLGRPVATPGRWTFNEH